MICPYCVEEVPANSEQHHECRIIKDQKFPPFYVDYHGSEEATQPIVLSVVGFSGHGKTVFLCALFEYLDHHLTYIWPDFFNHVLDQDSLSTLNDNRENLDKTILPARTREIFPRPGIFRLTNMPHVPSGNGMPPLEDTTILIYDPPGEAFSTEDGIVRFASFVKRSGCVLFLVDITSLGDSITNKMAKLLDTYVLGMRRMGIKQKSQHMIVVYTKSDDMKVSVPEFKSYLEKEPKLNNYLNEERPESLANPHAHLDRLGHISHLMETFTRSELKAGKFMNVAKDWFASVSYTVVSSLGGAPEEYINEEGEKEGRLPFKMSPRCVADPLLYVLAKSIEPKEPPPPPLLPTETRPRALIATITGVGALILLLLLIWLVRAITGSSNTSNTSASPTISRSATPDNSKGGITPPPRMVYVTGGEFTMGSDSGDIYEQPSHKVKVKPFFIDAYEVTCEEYARFVKTIGRAPPTNWPGGEYPQGAAQYPVTGVTWDDAVAYARWIGKRLPTEEEWEFAARGSDASHRYPWGRDWKEGMANAGGVSGGGLVNVGTFKGISPCGAYDMVGNAWEWTASELKPYPGGQLPFTLRGDFKVIRGGSWKENPEKATVSYRGYLLARGSKDYSVTGFRCAMDATSLPASPGK